MTNLILGTANFGNNYGITNGIINQKSTKKILDLAKKKNIKTIDTAYLYNNSYEALSIANIGDFRITTKTPKFLEFSNENELLNSLYKFIDKTDELLGLKNVEAILFHNSADLSSKYGSLLYKKLKELTKSYNVKIGISVYDEAELLLANEYDIDIVQAPLNIFDQRFIARDINKFFKSKNIELHARSIFLQGLLLMDLEFVKQKHPMILPHILDLDTRCLELGVSKLNICLSFIKSVRSLSYCVIGCSSAENLLEIVNCIDEMERKNKLEINFSNFHVNNSSITDPRKWQKI